MRTLKGNLFTPCDVNCPNVIEKMSGVEVRDAPHPTELVMPGVTFRRSEASQALVNRNDHGVTNVCSIGARCSRDGVAAWRVGRLAFPSFDRNPRASLESWTSASNA